MWLFAYVVLVVSVLAVVGALLFFFYMLIDEYGIGGILVVLLFLAGMYFAVILGAKVNQEYQTPVTIICPDETPCKVSPGFSFI